MCQKSLCSLLSIAVIRSLHTSAFIILLNQFLYPMRSMGLDLLVEHTVLVKYYDHIRKCTVLENWFCKNFFWHSVRTYLKNLNLPFKWLNTSVVMKPSILHSFHFSIVHRLTSKSKLVKIRSANFHSSSTSGSEILYWTKKHLSVSAGPLSSSRYVVSRTVVSPRKVAWCSLTGG